MTGLTAYYGLLEIGQPQLNETVVVSCAAGSTKISKMKYMRKRDDPFFRFVWFALRSREQDIVGF